jgi:hypothetical protein
MTTLREFLQDKAREQDQQERHRRREEWVAAVGRLLGQFRTWLQEADSDGLLELIPVDFDKLEEGLGAYRIQGLTIRLGGSEIRVVPVGRTVVGYFGRPAGGSVRAEVRVDITDGGRKYVLYRSLQDGEEHWYALNEQHESRLLDRERFEAIMQELLS